MSKDKVDEKLARKVLDRDAIREWEDKRTGKKEKRDIKKLTGQTVLLWVKGTAIVLLALFLLSCVAGLVLYFNDDQLSSEDADWDDVSILKEDLEDMDAEVITLRSSSDLLYTVGQANETILVMLGVEKRPTLTEPTAVQNFVKGGGILVLADDFGHGQYILDSMNGGDIFTDSMYPEISFRNDHVCDVDYATNPNFVIVNALLPFVSDKTYKIVTDVPAALEVKAEDGVSTSSGLYWDSDATVTSSADVNVLARTSDQAWLETEVRNHEFDEGEPRESFPIIAIAQLGAGAVVCVSDPGIFANALYDSYDNREFANDLFSILMLSRQTDDITVVFDESKHIQTDPARTAYSSGLLFVTLPARTFLTIVFLSIVLLVGLVALVPTFPVRFKNMSYSTRPWLLTMNRKDLTEADIPMMRSTFLETVRIASGLDEKQFKRVSRSRMKRYIGNKALSKFVLVGWGDGDETPQGPEKYTPEQLVRILNKMLKWKGPADMEVYNIPELGNALALEIKKEKELSIVDKLMFWRDD